MIASIVALSRSLSLALSHHMLREAACLYSVKLKPKLQNANIILTLILTLTLTLTLALTLIGFQYGPRRG